jgi:hypothetical protein
VAAEFRASDREQRGEFALVVEGRVVLLRLSNLFYDTGAAQSARQHGDGSVARISLAEFSERVRNQAIGELVTHVLADDDPWLFRKEAGTYQAFKSYLRVHLNDPDARALVVGSTKYGFSIAPDTFGRPCRRDSDIDVAILSPLLFDALWRMMLEWKYPWHVRKFEQPEREWALPHMENHVGGAIDPMSIRIYSQGAKRIPYPFQHFVNTWFDVFKQVSNIGPARGRVVEGRIYRSLEHLHRYVESGLTLVKQDHFKRS